MYLDVFGHPLTEVPEMLWIDSVIEVAITSCPNGVRPFVRDGFVHLHPGRRAPDRSDYLDLGIYFKDAPAEIYEYPGPTAVGLHIEILAADLPPVFRRLLERRAPHIHAQHIAADTLDVDSLELLRAVELAEPLCPCNKAGPETLFFFCGLSFDHLMLFNETRVNLHT